MLGDGGGHHRRRAGDDSPRVMVLGEADPLEPHLLGELAFLHAVLVALHGGFGIAVAGRSGPGGREVAAVSVAHRAQVRCFHVRQLLSRMSSEQLFQLVQQTLHISQSGGHVVGIVPILVAINMQVSCNGKQLSDLIVAGLGHQPRDRVIQRDVATMRPSAPVSNGFDHLGIWDVAPQPFSDAERTSPAASSLSA